MTIDTLMNDLLRVRPHGWSVTRSGDALSVRPPDRNRCKFRISFERDGRLSVARFDRALNHWTGFEYIEPAVLDADVLLEHLQRRTEADG